jgi:two-component sensor histidine kinase
MRPEAIMRKTDRGLAAKTRECRMSQLIESGPSRALAAEALLLREFSHRVGNEFAAAVGAISLAAARAHDVEVKSTLVAVENLLHNYATVHRCLRMPEHDIRIDATEYLRKLCLAISRSKLDSRGIDLLLVEHDVRMDATRCWRLGLIVSELITNSARHAFADGAGLIRVELTASETFYACRVSDNGRGAPSIRPGQGLRIINALAKGFEGSITQKFGRHGSTSILTFPIETRVSARSEQKLSA